MVNFPASLDTTGAGTLPTNHVSNGTETIQGATINDLATAVVALETKLGITASTPTVGKVLTGGSTAGTATWVTPASASASPYFNVLDYGAAGDGTTDDRAACQAAINAANGNGTVFFPPSRTFYLNSTGPLLIPPNATNLRLSGYGATIKLGVNAQTFCVPNRTTNNQIFQNITIEGFTVDGNNLTTSGERELIFGTLSTSQFNMSFRNWLIQDIYSYNCVTDTGNPRSNGRWHIVFATQSDGSGTAPGNLIENITVRRCTMLGGILGATIGTGTPNGLVVINRVLFEDLYHDTLVTPTAFAAMSNFHIGSYGRVRHAVIRRCYGFNSWDDGIEVNNPDPYILVEDCYGANSWNGFYAYVNYTTPTRNDLSRLIWKNCHYLVDTVDGTASAGWNVGFAGTNDHHDVEIINCSALDARTFIRPDFSYAAINIYGGVVIKNLVIRDFTASHSGWTWNPGSAAQTTEGLIYIEVNGTGSTVLIDGLTMLVRGTQTTAGAPNVVYAQPLRIVPKSATSRVEVRMVTAEFAITNNFAGTAAVLKLGMNGDASGCSIRTASIHGLKLRASTDTQPSGIQVGDSTNFTINDRINVDELDFSGVTATDIVKVYGGNATNLAKIFKYTTTAW